MKGMCPECFRIVDETEFNIIAQMCDDCLRKAVMKLNEECCMVSIKYPRLKITKGNTDYHYVCNVCEWNYFLDRYYPVAELILTVEHIK